MINQEVIMLAKKLWTYHHMDHEMAKAEAGSINTLRANYCIATGY